MESDSTIRTIRVRLGSPFWIRIWEDRTRGSRWNPTFDTASLRLVSDRFDRTRNIRVSDIGMRQFEFMPIRTGSYPIVFEACYGWKFSAEGRLKYEVEVAE